MRRMFAMAATVGAMAVACLVPAAGATPRMAPAASGDWEQFGFGPERSGYNPAESLVGPGNVATLAKVWGHSLAGLGSSSPAIAGDVLYLGTSDGVHALDVATGRPVWTAAIGTASDASPSVVGGVVYVGADLNFYALDAATGAVVWSHYIGGRSFSAAVTGGVVYVNSRATRLYNGKSYALDAATGAERWVQRINPTGSPAVGAGCVFVLSAEHAGYFFRCLDTDTGIARWTVPGTGQFLLAPVFSDGVVFITQGDEILGLDAATGSVLWTTDRLGFQLSAVAVANGVVFVAVDDFGASKQYAIDGDTGDVVWVVRADGPQPSGSPAVANGVVYFDTAYFVDANDAATGARLWSIRKARVFSPPVISNGTLYFVTLNDGRVWAYGLPA